MVYFIFSHLGFGLSLVIIIITITFRVTTFPGGRPTRFPGRSPLHRLALLLGPGNNITDFIQVGVGSPTFQLVTSFQHPVDHILDDAGILLVPDPATGKLNTGGHVIGRLHAVIRLAGAGDSCPASLLKYGPHPILKGVKDPPLCLSVSQTSRRKSPLDLLLTLCFLICVSVGVGAFPAIFGLFFGFVALCLLRRLVLLWSRFINFHRYM
mmetsp:Transcript_20815/g.59667  ORF Transcript_20815/g.59667 Transcript_20815/m.59667 type:complete len:210 (-) Transcript_20815:193-822(-)